MKPCWISAGGRQCDTPEICGQIEAAEKHVHLACVSQPGFMLMYNGLKPDQRNVLVNFVALVIAELEAK